MSAEYAQKNLQKASFKNASLENQSFRGSDLRGADFSGAKMNGADLSEVKTGVTPGNKAGIFIIALTISLLSGYVAMLAGKAAQSMLKSPDEKLRIAGMVTVGLTAAFIVFFYFKGGRNLVRQVLVPVVVVALLLSLVASLTGLGTGKGMLFIAGALVLVVIMFIVGTVARALAGTLSSPIIFMCVAMGGGMFGTNLGGGIGTVIMALSCAVISKRALSGAKGFEGLRKIATYVTARFGTSFKDSTLEHADFSRAKVHNSDFTGADLSSVNWTGAKKANCVE